MIHYELSYLNPSNQYISIQFTFQATKTIHQLQLPAWRPGRYELGNFAKNIRKFNINSENQPVEFYKITKDCWELKTKIGEKYTIQYEYYSNELNAGSTYLSPEQLYVNPVNCFMYVIGMEHEEINLELKIPKNYLIACGLKQNNNKLEASNFDEFADSPFICSSTLKHNSYSSNNTLFHIWFQGEVKPDWNKILSDFQKFTDKQIEKFSDFPVKEYHFLIHISPYRTYHGVEHKTSTVIHLGPSFDIFGEVYSDLLGVCSHELYHTWNVKSIRPIEMFPYDFTKENYSTLGYLCEGVTTYMGDLMLLKSGIFSLEDYIKELETQVQKHIDNEGRFNYSVSESSFDTWLDGYVLGAPGRKTSIYTEGCLLSFYLDVLIIKNSEQKYSLDDVMFELYNEYYKKNKGVSEAYFIQVLEKYAKISLKDFWNSHVLNPKDYIEIIKVALNTIGLDLSTEASKSRIEQLGIKTIFNGTNHQIKSILSNSAADQSGLMLEDEIISINNFEVKADFEKWLNYFNNDSINLLIKRKSKFYSIELKKDSSNCYQKAKISVNSSNNPFFEKWIS